jgi:virginiamycin B lyase
MKSLFSAIALAASAWMIWAQDPPAQAGAQADSTKKARPRRPPPPGVSTPGVKRDMSEIHPDAVFPVEGTPDWQVVTDDAIWVSNGPKNSVHRLDVKTNAVAAAVTVGKRPCSGLAAGFGSVWVPNCGDKTISRVDMKTNTVVATIAVGPAASEAGIAASPEGVWIVTDAKGVLSKIDPAENKVVAEVTVPANSAGVTYGEGAVWVTTPETNMLTRVDPKSATVTASIEVGSKPRFLTTGAGSAWTLNQGDGTITRVNAKTAKVVATIEAGLTGTGGELAFGEGRVWATIPQIPLSEIDPATNQVVRQWVGPGGDSVRAAHGSVWLSNLREQNVWRFKP